MMKITLFIIELLAIFAFNSAAPIYNEGNIFGIAFFIFLIFVTLFFDKVKKLFSKITGKIIILSASFFMISGVIYAGILSVFMADAISNKPADPKTMIVLGCQVDGTVPSKMLARRLDTAYDALIEYPDAVCIVSGGMGSGEGISEAECMYRYLVNKGVSPERIITEDRSTSTSENIRYSFELTDDRDITIVTDGFHQYRASLIAKHEGAENVTSLSAKTELRFLPTYWVREWFGITYFYIFGK